MFPFWTIADFIETKVLLCFIFLTPVLYQAAIHPEQYSNTLPKSALKTLHEKIHSVTTVAAAVLGDSSKFPEDWLFSYRWGKGSRGKKGGKEENNVLPNGEKIIHITVGGRTSAVVESRQKKIRGSGEEEEEEVKKPAKKKGTVKEVKDPPKKSAKEKESPATKKSAKVVKAEETTPKKKRVSTKVEEEVEEEAVTPKKRRISGKAANGTPKSTPTQKSSRGKA
jgi:formamidopyrimidine-DNA glycosylase